MTVKMEHFPAKNPHPVLSVAYDGTVLYSNEAAKPLLIEWGVRVGERLPSSVRDLVQRVISRNSSKKMEVKAGKRVYMVTFHPLLEDECVNIYGFDISDQIEVEEKLRESEERLILAQQVAKIGTFEWNIQTGENVWTPELEGMYGLLPGEFGKTKTAWEKLVHPEDRQKAISLVEHSFKTSEPVEGEWRVVWPDGSVHWLTGRWHVFKDEAGQPLRITGVNIDTTERKQAEEALKKQAALIDLSPDGIISRQLNGTINFWNKGAQSLYGWTSQEAIGQIVHTLLKTRFPQPFEQIIKQVQQTGYWSGELIHCTKDGRQVIVQSRWLAEFDDQGNVKSILESNVDITERKKTEEDLWKSENRFRVMFEEHGAPMLLIEPNSGQIIDANEAAARFYEYSREQLRAMYIDQINQLPPEEVAAERYNAIERSKNVFVFTHRLASGDERLVEVYSSPVTIEGRPMLFSIIHDITLRKKAEEALKKAHENLEEKVKERTEELEIAYESLRNFETIRKQEIHHRIKNNLQVISSLLDLEAEKFKSKKNIEDSQVIEAFKESQDRVFSMALIHEELHKDGKLDTLNFSHYIKELVDNLLLTYSIGNNRIILNTDIEEDIFFDMDTAVPLGIIINELVSNSLKHAFPCSDKGKIQIKLHREKNGECESEDCNPAYVLMISDNGIGIPEDLDIEDIDSLGLQLVTSLVDQLDGEFELKSNNGTEFIVRFTVKER